MKNEKAVLYGIIGFLAGIVLTVFFASNAVNNNMTGAMRMMGMRLNAEKQEIVKEVDQEDTGMGMNSSMDDMMESLSDTSDDEFDRAFINAMIPHHQGAIEMAKEAQKNAQHDELKKMADDIISSQTAEVGMMKQWQKDWGD